MSKKISLIIIILVISFSASSGQEKDSLINKLYSSFESFEYGQVIEISDRLLENKAAIDQRVIIEIYRIRATAQFTIYNEDSAKTSLRQIILLDEKYELDPVKNSPKLISMFEDLKQIHFLEKQNKAMQDSLQSSEIPKDAEVFYSRKDILNANTVYRNSIIRSIFLPGWGHLYIGKDQWKGTILTAASAAALGGMIYSIIETNKKEKDYLQESNKALINSKYDSFNKSYKLRNFLIAGFSAIWLYSQVDLLYFSSGNYSITTALGPSPDSELYLSLLFEF